MLRRACSVFVYVFACVPVYLLVKGSQIFDAERGFSADGDFLKRCDLRCGESYRRCEGGKVDELTVKIGEFPVSSKMNVTRVGNEVEFTEQVFRCEGFPFRVGAASETDKGRFEIFKTFGIVEDTHAEDPVRSLCCQCGQCLQDGEQIDVQI